MKKTLPVVPPTSPLKILLVEDIAMNQTIALRMLKRLGYQADIANTGQEAIEAVQQQSYDVIFMDIQMPGMDGLEATRRIRQQGTACHPWIIAMTAYVMQGDRERCLEAGMNDYLPKPISTETLASVLSSFQSWQAASACQNGIGAAEMGQADRVDPGASLSFKTGFQRLPYSRAAAVLDAGVLEQLRSMAGEDADALVAEVVESYLRDAPQRLKTIALALARQDTDTLHRAAHALHSISAAIGATHLASLCGMLESLNQNNSLEMVSFLLASVQSEYNQVAIALSPLVRRLS